jgi:hypothetical protein
MLSLVLAVLALPVVLSAQVQLTSPFSASYCIGSNITIKWSYKAGAFESSPKVSIELKRSDGATVRQIAAVGASTGQFIWMVPGGLTPGNGYIIALSAPAGGATTTQFAINGLPQITMPPMSVALCEGAPHTLSVAFAGGTVSSIQWRRNGTNIAGATGATLPITASTSTAGAYSVVLSSACGPVTSNAAQVTLSPPTTMTVTPVSKTLRVFTAQASGPSPSFQWRRNGVPIAGQTGNVISVEPGAETAGTYSVVVSSSCATPVTATDPSWVVGTGN